MSDKTKFSTSIVAITGLITAVGGLITILFNTGFFGDKKGDEKKQPEKEVVYIPEEKNDDEQVIRIDPEPKSFVDEEVIPKPKPKPEPKVYNLTGNWFDPNYPGAKYYFNHESSGAISFTEYSSVFGQWVVTSQGTGTISSNKRIEIPYNTSVGTNGRFDGVLSNNGKTISGTASDFVSGASLPFNLNKQ